MRKLILALLITIAVSTYALGATSNDIQEGIYLRQDVFEAKMDTFIAEIRLMNEQLRSELKQEIQDTKAELRKEIQDTKAELKKEIQANSTAIQVTNARLDELKTMVYWGIALLGILITLAAVAPSLVQVAKELKQQTFSLEDIERLIDAKINQKNAVRNN